MSKKRKHRFGYESNIVVHHRSVNRRAASVSLPDRWADEKRTPFRVGERLGKNMVVWCEKVVSE